MLSVRFRSTSALVAVTAAVLLAGTAGANAATFGQAELSYDGALISQFNLINLGNFTSSGATTGGRELVGGNATYNSAATVCSTTGSCGNTALGVTSSPTAGVVAATSSASSPNASNYGYGALTVFGNIAGSVTIGTSAAAQGTPPAGTGGDINVKGNATGTATYALNNAGGFNIAGTSTTSTTIANVSEVRFGSSSPQYNSNSYGGSNYNGNYTTGASPASVFAPFGNSSAVSANFQTPLQNLYSGLANLPGSPGVTTESIPSNKTIFTSGTDYTTTLSGKTYNYGVVQTTLANLNSLASSGFTGIVNGSSNQATFVIVTGFGNTNILPTLTANSANVIYDFVGASSLQTGTGAFNGTILAPLATLTQGSGGTIAGSVIVQAMTQTQALSVGPAFTGDLSGLTNFVYNARVPEPTSLLLLGGGLAGLAWIRRKR